MASQRHKMIHQYYGATCTAIDEKQPSSSYLRQIPGPYVVPVGAPGGPLKGSSLAGPAPAAIPSPQLEHPLLALGLLLAGSQQPPEPPAADTELGKTDTELDKAVAVVFTGESKPEPAKPVRRTRRRP